MSLSSSVAACYDDFKLAFALLTRFGGSKIVQDNELSGAIAWFGFVGMLIGLFLTAPIYALGEIASPWMLAWCYVLLEVYITRALHLDGVADVADASHTTGTRFWDVIYDSRIGAFGAVALFLALSALLLGAYESITAQDWRILILAPAFGRMLVVLFACITPVRDHNSLAGKTCSATNPILFLIYFILIASILWFFEFAPVMGILMTSTLFLAMMWRLARKQGGCNGDFLGTVIVGGQIIFFFFL